jgi:hypothetical protein
MDRRVILGAGVGVGFIALVALVGQRQCSGHRSEARGRRGRDSHERRGARGKRFLDDVQAIRDNTDRMLEVLAETRGREHEHMATA